MKIPPVELSDDALRLRSWRASDAPVLAAAWADADVAKWTAVPRDASLAAARHWIDGETRRRESGRAVDLALERLEPPIATTPSAAPVCGEVGMAPIDWERAAAQVGYWLLPDCRGSGLASRALVLFTHWATERLGLRMVVARCHEENSASISVATAAGYGLEGRDEEGFGLYVYRAGTSTC